MLLCLPRDMKRKLRSSDAALDALAIWPDGLSVDGVELTTKSVFVTQLTLMRRDVDQLLVDYNFILDYYSEITSSLMSWLEVSISLIVNIVIV